MAEWYDAEEVDGARQHFRKYHDAGHDIVIVNYLCDLSDAQHADNVRLRGVLKEAKAFIPPAATDGRFPRNARNIMREWIDTVLADDACPCGSGGMGDDGLAKQPCDKCDAEPTL